MARILIAEDEPDIRELIAFTLSFAGHEVISGSNGEEAVQLARQNNPDLVILDVRMPRMTGYEACHQIKTDASLSHIPVIFLSAKGQEAEMQAGLDAGCVDYIVKPFSPDQLTHQVLIVLEKCKKGQLP
jgi:DNA-binding response OmpR family regulator